jgi:hypothetical protein
VLKTPFIVIGALSLVACQTIPQPRETVQVKTDSVDSMRPRYQSALGNFAPTREPLTTNDEYCRRICTDDKRVASSKCHWSQSASESKVSSSDIFRTYGWPIVSLTSSDDIASLADYHYEIAMMNWGAGISVSPATSTERFDRFTITSSGNQLWLTQDRGDPYNPVFVSSARLTLRPENPPHLWAEGYAYADAGGTEPIGIFRVFRLRDRAGQDNAWCRHSHYPYSQTFPKYWCRSVLVEFYDSNDPINSLNAPIVGRNVIKESCADLRALETSDGEGDEGPNKPR